MNSMIQRPKPIADQVEDFLLAKIREGIFPPGSRLPPENELAAQLGVSRTSVRSALAALESKRLILRRQGDGTYVNRRLTEVSTRMGEEWDFVFMIKDQGGTPSVETIEICTRPATPDEANGLEIHAEEKVLSIRRLFLANDQPAIFSTNVLPAAILKSQGPFDVNQPLNEILRAYCDEEIYYSISDISASFAPEEVYEVLRINPGTPLLRFNDVFYNQKDQPLVVGINYFYDQALCVRVARSWGLTTS